jgi:hypothetical protein
MYREHDIDYCRNLARHALQGKAAVEGKLEPAGSV